MKHTYHRAAQVEKQDGSSDVFPCTISSNAPVSRGDFVEVLSHDPGAVDLSRAPLPLIESHDSGKLNIGLVEDLTLVGGKLRGMLRLGKSARAQEIKQDIQDGIVGALSVGYRWVKWVDKNDTVTVTRWQPLEVSLVAVPADINAGIFRNLNMEYQMQIEENDEQDLSRGQRRAQRHGLENQQAAAEAERGRIRAIEEMCKTHKVDANVARELIDSGSNTEIARRTVLEIISARRYTPVTGPDSYGNNYEGSGQDYGFGRADMQDFSICRALVASAGKDWRKAGLERSMSDAISQRVGRQTEGFFVPLDLPMARAAYATGAPSTGGNVVATNLLASSFIDILRNRCQVINLGATMLTGLVGNVDIPRRSSATTAYWVAEAGSITESEGTFDKISLSPKTVAALSRYSRNMLIQSTPDIEMLVRGDLVEIIALAIDKAALYGPGTGNQPTGIFNTGGIGSVVGGTNGGQVTLDHMLDLVAAVMNANAAGTSMGYLVNSKTQTSLSKLKSTTGQYLWARGGEFTSIAERMVDRINGYPVLQTNQLPSNNTKGTGTNLSSLCFGDWSSLVIGEWGVLEILPNPYGSGFATGQVDIRAMQSVDIGIRHPESFAVMSDAITG
ncbi:phage prohead protease, HK97 family/phage major capsid protein, HK97 family,TIGR01554 [Nitrosospira sp. Nsp11]|uniref:phage major capsid protein n=1 Tax=Nitrosospira sp. Nsp11 TaxID=1855338 RepID=UPI000918B8B9|nr:phage major capsid protein [Nitrosospira sp. Nsp11]SHM19948.1 phage prohead protease, HK97 family/phage major capsid protein, HK97 family,TIGR01554 [Nitrosospira sp. Nsp11]